MVARNQKCGSTTFRSPFTGGDSHAAFLLFFLAHKRATIFRICKLNWKTNFPSSQHNRVYKLFCQRRIHFLMHLFSHRYHKKKAFPPFTLENISPSFGRPAIHQGVPPFVLFFFVFFLLYSSRLKELQLEETGRH